MGTLNEFLAEKRAAVRGLRAAASADPKAKPFQASCRVLGRSGVREVRIRDYQVITDTPAYCVPLDVAGLRQALAAAERGVELPHGSWRRAG